MKRILFLALLLSFAFFGCSQKDETSKEITNKEVIQEYVDTIVLDEITTDIDLLEEVTYKNKTISIKWISSDESILTNDGKVIPNEDDSIITLNGQFKIDEDSLSKDFEIIVKGKELKDVIEYYIKDLTLPETITNDLSLQNRINIGSNTGTITWTSSDQNILTNKGKYGYFEEDSDIIMTAAVAYRGIICKKSFNIKVIAYSDDIKLSKALDNISIPSMVCDDIPLPKQSLYNSTVSWISSNTSIIDNTGKLIKNVDGKETITLTATVSLNNQTTEKSFNIVVTGINHIITDRTFTGQKENTEIKNGKLELLSTATSGTYTTSIIETLDFDEAVGSWAAITSTTATCEFEVRIRVNGNWSKYITYGKWGQGLQNACYDQSDSIIKLTDDEIIVQNGKNANALQMRITLRRSTVNEQSPVVTLLAITLNIPIYTYEPSISALPKSVDYNVPKLYQINVPSIGNSICSATSSTMLLKYKGHNFTDKDSEFEHRYIASIVKDYGNNIYGNWVYNTVGISSYGEISYVMRMYSYQELLVHLATVGPVAASVKGTLIGELGSNWTTNGHLIVVRGYKIDANGNILILVNDPAISRMYEEFKLENFLNIWRNVVYVIE